MSTQLQLRRGTASQTASFTGAPSEVTIDTTNNSLVVHDGITQGGFPAGRKDLVNIDNATFYAKGIESGLGTGGGGSLAAIVGNITKSNPGVVTTTTNHNFSDGQQVTFTNVGGMTQLNGNAYFCDVLTSNTFALYSDPGLSTTLNTTSFGTYTSGGNVVATTAPGAPTTAAYVVMTANPTLTSERTLTASLGLTLQDGGPGGGATLSVNLANTVPNNLGSAAAGAANTVSRSDHVHAMPTAVDVGAVPVSRYVIAGNGLQGGGALSANVTLNLYANLSSLRDVVYSGNLVNGDALVYNSASQRWENTQNLPRITMQSNDGNVGTPNAVKTLNFNGAAVTAGQVIVSADTDPTKVSISIPEIFTQERVEDIVGGMVSGSTQNGVTVTYDDPNGKLNFSANTFAINLTGAVQGSGTVTALGNVTITTQNAPGGLNIFSDTVGNYTTSLATAAANTITVVNTAGNSHGATYTVALNTAAPDYTESVQDISAELLNLNTGTRGITATYDDANAKVSLSANPFTITLSGDLSGQATVSNLGNVTLTAQIAANAVALSTDTTGSYVATLGASAANTITVTNSAGDLHGATYTIGLNTSSVDYIESVQDIAAGLLNQNAGNLGITAVYDDANAKVSLSANPFTITLGGDLTGSATVANLGNITLTAQIAANSVALGTDTSGNYVQQVTVSGSGISATGTGEGANVAIAVSSATNNAGNTLVYRDQFGSFAANVITASLVGNASLNVLRAGDTMTGALVLSGNPTANLHAATKQYVDSTVSAASFSLNTSAGSGTGTLVSGDTLAIAGGNGITTSLTGDTFTVTNSGVTSLTAGTGITLSSSTGAVTISASGTVAGVSSINSQSGAVTLQGTSAEIEITQPGSGIVQIGLPNSVTIPSLAVNTVSATQTITATGNVTGGNLITSGSLTAASISVSTGTVTLGNIVNSNANGIGNIGSSTTYFDTVFAKATSAQYADVAEMYRADRDYQPGTVVKFGGEFEVTLADDAADPMVAGIVSTNPAYLMNSGLTGANTVALALTGRVPCKVVGPIKKGQMLVSAGSGHARAELAPAMGTVIGKALEDFDGEIGLIEVVVGRL